MKITLVILGAIVIAAVAIELIGNIIAKCTKSRVDRMSPDEQRQYQEAMYKRQQMG